LVDEKVGHVEKENKVYKEKMKGRVKI